MSFWKLEQVADKEVIAEVLLLSGKLDFRACLWVWWVGRTIESNVSDLHG